jgi:hypothetical protein
MTTAFRRLRPASRPTRRLLAGVAVCLLALAGCSSGPSANEWAAAVCGALAPWRSTIDELNRQAATQMATATTSEQTRENLMRLFGGARQASETARAAVEAAGVPDVEGGEAVAHGFEASLAGTRDAYAQAEADLAALPIMDDTAFYDGVTAVLTRLTDQYQGSGIDLAGLDSPELRQAFDGIDECR